MSNIDFEKDVTREMYEAVVEASLYGEDAEKALCKVLPPKRYNKNETREILQYIHRQKDKIEEVKKDIIEIEKASLIDHDQDTIMLVYNRLIQKAQAEGKYDVVTRVLREIRQLKAIENEQMKFEVVIKVEKPKEGLDK